MRINDFSVAMTKAGMWAKVAIEVYGERIEGILGRSSELYLCFASNSELLNGSYEFKNYRSDWQFVIDDYQFLTSCQIVAWIPNLSSHLLVSSMKVTN